jgi:hypothetical protein
MISMSKRDVGVMYLRATFLIINNILCFNGKNTAGRTKQTEAVRCPLQLFMTFNLGPLIQYTLKEKIKRL